MPLVRVVVAVVTLMVAVTACSQRVAGDEPPTGGAYVALGDSYTSAPGTGINRGDTCYQSAVNYPRLIAVELDLELTDASCNGARTANLTEPQDPTGNPPQLDALSEETELVTIRIGANDEALYAVSVIRCAQVAWRDRDGAPCAEQFGGTAQLEAATDRIRARFDRALDAIADRAPEARIVVVGYPQWAPPEPPEECAAFALADGDYAYARRANELLTRTLREAAAEAEVDHVDMWAASEGHDMCSDDPWIAGLERTDRAAAVHPFPEEQEAVADLVVELLRS